MSESVRPLESGVTLVPGQVLGQRYRVERWLGSGGMGAVYLASHVRVERRFAIKVLTAGVDERELMRRFEREARIAGALESRHIVKVFDVDQTDEGVPYLVMEYVPGEDLRRILTREGSFSLRRAVNLVAQACEGVGAAHDRQVIHRDLKPSNLMVSVERDGYELCQVGDFGVAHEGDDYRNQDTLATQTGAMIGTLAYMSPEQIRGEKLDQRSDIYSLGAILYECLAERRAFVADAPHSLIYKILHERPAPLASLRPDLPEAVAKLVERAMAREREDRFERVDHLARALKAILPAGTSLAEATELDHSRSQLHAPKARRRGFELGVIALAGAAVGAVATSASLRGSTENGDTAAASAAAARGQAVVEGSVEPVAAVTSVSSTEREPESAPKPAISARPRPRIAPAPFPVPPTKPSTEPAPARLNPDAAIDPFASRQQ